MQLSQKKQTKIKIFFSKSLQFIDENFSEFACFLLTSLSIIVHVPLSFYWKLIISKHFICCWHIISIVDAHKIHCIELKKRPGSRWIKKMSAWINLVAFNHAKMSLHSSTRLIHLVIWSLEFHESCVENLLPENNFSFGACVRFYLPMPPKWMWLAWRT